MDNMILVTDWDVVDKDDFYLSTDWLDQIGSKSRQRQLKRMVREGNLYEAYVVPALSYAIYVQMDAHQVFIDGEGDEQLSCESVIIGRDHSDRWEYSY